VNITLHNPETRVQLVSSNEPEPVAEKETIPLGVPYPVNVAVQVEAVPTVTGLVHDSESEVAAWVTVTEPSLAPEDVLTALLVSPSYVVEMR
jgi:hypothetical protein